MGIQNVCDGFVEETEGLLACVVLDLDTGLSVANSCREGMEAVAGSAVLRGLGGLFRGRSPGFATSSSTATPSRGVVREAQVTTGSTYHFMATVPGWDNALLVFVTEKAVSIGLGWMAVHQAVHRVAQARPGAAETETARGAETSPPVAPQDPPAVAQDPPAVTQDPRAVPGERPAAPEKQAAQSLRGVGPAATAPGRVAPPVRRRVTAPSPQPPALPEGSLERGEPRVGHRAMRESTQSSLVSDEAEPPGLAARGPQEKPPVREPPRVRSRRPPPVSAASVPAEPAEDEDPKTDVGRMGARPVFGSKTRRS